MVSVCVAGLVRYNHRCAGNCRAIATRMLRRVAGDGSYLRARDRRDGHGYVKEDPEFDPSNSSNFGGTIVVEVKKRPMGCIRYTHGENGKGAMVVKMYEKARYPGDPRGQIAVAGVKTSFLVKSIAGQSCVNWDFQDIMDLLEDSEGDYNATQEAKAEWEARPRKFQATELPATVEFVEYTGDLTAQATQPTRVVGKWYPRGGGYSEEQLEQERQRAQKEFPLPADYKGVVYSGPACLTDSWIQDFMKQQRNGIRLPKAMAYALVIDAIKELWKEKTMSEISVPPTESLTVCGDFHGQYWDLMNVFEWNGVPSPSNPYLFNGDFVDRGSWSVEIILTLFAMKIKDPLFMHLNRGNHELIEANLIYGFCGECCKKYDAGLFDLFSESFRYLSLCHLINKEIFVTHGGLPGPNPRQWLPGQSHDPEDAIPVNVSTLTLAEIAAVDRFTELQANSYKDAVGDPADDAAVETRIVIDLLWADPRGGAGYGPSYRKSRGIFMFGPDVTAKFCKDNGLKYVIRSHELKPLGWSQDHDELYTVFSAPDYMDTGGNQGAFLKLTNEAGKLTISPTSYGKVDHPKTPPMLWQEYMIAVNPHLTKKMKKKVGLLYDANGNITGEVSDLDQGDSDSGAGGMGAEWVDDDGSASFDPGQMSREQIEAKFDKFM